MKQLSSIYNRMVEQAKKQVRKPGWTLDYLAPTAYLRTAKIPNETQTKIQQLYEVWLRKPNQVISTGEVTTYHRERQEVWLDLPEVG